jgi:hypothetical protein
MSEPSSAEFGARPNKVALVALVTMGSAIGLLPYFLFIERLPYLGAVVAASAAIAFLKLRKSDALAAENPSLGEWLLAAWSAVGLPAGASMLGLLLYAIVYCVAQFVVWVLGLVGAHPTADPSSMARWTSLVIAGMFMLWASSEGSRHLLRGLYPRTAGTRSVFFPLLNRPYLLAGIVAGFLVALGLMLAFAHDWPRAFPVVLGLMIFYSSFPLARLLDVPKAADRQCETLAMLFERAGYRVVRSPRTGKPEVDPLIQNVDLFVRAGGNAFAVQVQSLEPSAKADWHLASALRTAASILEQEWTDEEAAPLHVTPVLVIVGGEITPSLTRFKEAESIPVAEFKDPAVFGAEGSSAQVDGAIAGELRGIGIPLPAIEPAPEGREDNA